MVAAVQEESLPAVWSRGVSLARKGAVAGESRSDEEWSFRVRLPGDAIAPRVILYPQDEEWDCDCDGPLDPCEHVAACAIASGSPESFDALFAAETRLNGLRYEFRQTPKGLSIERALVCGDQVVGVRESLEELSEDNPDTVGFEPTGADVSVDLLLGGRGGLVPPGRLEKILHALVGVDQVYAEGRLVRVAAEPVRPQAVLLDQGPRHVELRIEAYPPAGEPLGPGLVCLEGTLRPMADRVRFGTSSERLPFRRRFSRATMGDLVSRILPRLEKDVDLKVQASNVAAEAEVLQPWIEFQMESRAENLDVLPRLVYGNPPVASVEDGKMRLFSGTVPLRQDAAEKSLVLKLRAELNLVPGRWAHFSAGDGARFLSAMRSFDENQGYGKSTGEGAGSGRPLVPAFRDNAAAEGLEVVFRANGDAKTSVAAQVVVEAWRQGVDVVPLPGGGFGNLPSQWLADHASLLEDLVAAIEANQGTPPAATITLLAAVRDSLDSPPPLELRSKFDLADSLPALPVEMPRGFRGTLRPYQAQGVAWLERLRRAGLGALLADDMGLGKTVQAICAVRGRTLIVCPRSVIHNWVREAQSFVPDSTIHLYHGPGRRLEEADLTVTTYATLRRDSEALREVVWDSIVLDEAQAIKNPSSQVAQAAYSLRGDFRLCLSGTPVENRLDELWSQMHFANPGFLGGRSSFATRYEKPILSGDLEAIERLRARLEPFVLRRLKDEVAEDLPARTETTLFTELDQEEREVYEVLRRAARSEVVGSLSAGGSVMSAFEVLLRLRQAACHRGLLPGVHAPSSSKVEALLGALEDVSAGGHKALVFSQWTQLLDRLESSVSDAGICSVRLDGSTRDRGAVVDRFQNDPEISVFLISLQAGGTGLNLTAADHVFFMDPWWNPAVEAQAADRAHRIGQDRPVMIYRLVAKDTVEERVLGLQAQKRNLAQAALGGGGLSGSAVTRDELLALLA